MKDYIKTMRALIGHETLITVGCGAIIEDQRGRILLQKRLDDIWGIPGGLLEIGETFEETARREVLEETGFILKRLELFGLYSGKNGFARYPNGDRVFSVQIIFRATEFQGTLKSNNESKEMRFVSKINLPKNLNPHQAPFILDWLNSAPVPVLR